MIRYEQTVRIDHNMPVKQARRVRAAAATAATTIESYKINLIRFVSSFIITVTDSMK